MGRSEPPEILLNIAIGNPNWHVTGSHQGIPQTTAHNAWKPCVPLHQREQKSEFQGGK